MTPARFLRGCHAKKRVLNRFFGIRDFPHLKLGIWDFKAKPERDLGLKVFVGGGMPNITLGITGLHEVLGLRVSITDPPSLAVSEKLHLISDLSYPMLPNTPAI